MQYRQIFVIYEKKICIVTIFLDIKAKGFLFDSMLDHIFGDIRFCQLCSSSKSIQRAWTANPADDKCTNPMDDKSTNPNVSRQTINPELVRTRYVGFPDRTYDHFCCTRFPFGLSIFFSLSPSNLNQGRTRSRNISIL